MEPGQTFIPMAAKDRRALQMFDVQSLNIPPHILQGIFADQPAVNEAAARLLALCKKGAEALHDGNGSPLQWCGVPLPLFDAMLYDDLEQFGTAFKDHQQALENARLKNAQIIAQNRASVRTFYWYNFFRFGIPAKLGAKPKMRQPIEVRNGHIPTSGIFAAGADFAKKGLTQLREAKLVRVVRRGRQTDKFDVVYPTHDLLAMAGNFFSN